MERVRGKRTVVGLDAPQSPQLSTSEMLDWLQREVSAVSKEAELRIRDATTFVTEYARGRISGEEADKRFHRYADRWPDALRGTVSPEGKTDEQIVRELDRDRAKGFSR